MATHAQPDRHTSGLPTSPSHTRRLPCGMAVLLLAVLLAAFGPPAEPIVRGITAGLMLALGLALAARVLGALILAACRGFGRVRHRSAMSRPLHTPDTLPHRPPARQQPQR